MDVIAVLNEKGGVGKTSLVANLAYLSAVEGGKTVLAIDLDQQANLSSLYSDDVDAEPSVSAVFKHRQFDIAECSRPAIVNGETVPNFFIAHSNIRLPQALREIPVRVGREKMLAKSLANIDVDVVFIDCPPSADDAVLNAIYAANKIIVPVEMAGFATNAIQDVIDLITDVKGYTTPEEMMASEKIIFVRNKYDRRVPSVNNKVNRSLLPIDDFVAKTVCRVASDLNHAIFEGMPLSLSRPKSPLAGDYRALMREVV